MQCNSCQGPAPRKVRLAKDDEEGGNKPMSTGVIIGIIVLIFMIVVSVGVGLACSCSPSHRQMLPNY